MGITLLILLLGFPIICASQIAVEQWCRGIVGFKLRLYVAEQMRQDFGRGVVPSRSRSIDILVRFLRLSAWTAVAGSLIQSLISPVRGEIDVGISGALFLMCCLFLDVSRFVPAFRASRSQAEMGSVLTAILQSLALGLVIGGSLAGAAVLFGSFEGATIAAVQAHSGVWGIALQPLGFLTFLGAVLLNSCRNAERNEAFALANSMKTICLAMLFVILYGGGWHFWGLTTYTTAVGPSLSEGLLRGTVFVIKTMVVLSGMVLFRVKIVARKPVEWMEGVRSFLLPLTGINFLVALVAEAWLGPHDDLSRCLLSWIVAAGIGGYVILFHRGAATKQGKLIRG